MNDVIILLTTTLTMLASFLLLKFLLAATPRRSKLEDVALVEKDVVRAENDIHQATVRAYLSMVAADRRRRQEGGWQ